MSYRAHVTVTDLEDLQTLLSLNIKENQIHTRSGSITAKVLKWFVLIYNSYLYWLNLKLVSYLNVFNHIDVIAVKSGSLKGVKMLLISCLPHIMFLWQTASIMRRYYIKVGSSL